MNIALISEYLETYQGRDKFLRTLSYMAKFATLGILSKEIEEKFKIFSSQMSGCRVILRLLDDIPMIHYVMTYGWGKKRHVNFISNVIGARLVDQMDRVGTNCSGYYILSNRAHFLGR